MAREREEGGRPARPARKSGTPKVFGLAVVLVVLAGVLALFLATNKKQPQAAAPAPVNPFADLPPEPPPVKQAPHKADLQREQQEQEKAKQRE